MNYKTSELIQAGQINIENFLAELGIGNIREEIINGIQFKERYVSSKFFYDERGSNLFEEITHLEEYYPTRTEKNILRVNSSSIMSSVSGMDIVELGSGDCSKIKVLLDSVPAEILETIRYIPVDLSQSAVNDAASQLAVLYPDLLINGIVADFFSQLHLIPDERPRLFCFFGSTIGNFEKADAIKFIQDLANIMHPADRLLLGMDMVKEESVLNDAYNDSQGVTAAFNKNILSVVNGIIESDFNENDFEHRAFFNRYKSRIEMHLVANKEVSISSMYFNENCIIQKGESIHTENSHKYTIKDIEDFAFASGLQVKQINTDNNKWFSLVEFIK